MKKIMLGIAITSAVVMVGCVSVENVRAKLNSSDVNAVNEGKRTILSMASERPDSSGNVLIGFMQFASEEDRIKYIELIEDHDFLLEVIDKLLGVRHWNKNALAAACSRLNFKNEEEAIKFLKEYKYKKYDTWMYKENKESIHKAVDSLSSERALITMYHEMNPSQNLWAMKQAKQAGGEPKEVDWNIRALVNQKVAMMVNDQSILKELAKSDRENGRIAIKRINDDEILFSLMNEYYQDVIPYMSIKFIMQKLLAAEDDNLSQFKQKIEDFMDRLNEDKLYAYLAINAKSSYIKEKAVERIKDKSILNGVNIKVAEKLKGMDAEKADELVKMLLEKDVASDLAHTIITNMPAGIRIDSQVVLAEKVADSAIAKWYFDNIDFSCGYNSDKIDEYGFKILMTLLSKMDADTRRMLERKAISNAQKAGDKIVFEGMYVKMPFIDFAIIAHAHGITPYSFWCVSQDENKLSRSTLSSKDWRKKALVDTFTLRKKDVMKFIDCEDAQILSQIIHKYVMKKPGKCDGYEYLKLIKFDVVDNSKFSTNYYTGQSSYHSDVKGWSVYSNTKKDTEIRFTNDGGLVRFTTP